MDGTRALLRHLVVMALAVALVGGAAACGDDDEASDGVATGDTADLEAVTDVLVAGGATQEVAACEAELLLQQVDDGTITEEELQAWLDGDEPVGPVQDAVVEIERSQACANADADA